ncbi:MAG TPA: hypothetical protein VGC29_00685 [Flavisolibacter sp.]
MKISFTCILLGFALITSAQQSSSKSTLPGTFSLGTRNTISAFNDDESIGKGIGGQFRLQLLNRLGSEWYFDYITSRNGELTYRNDYHIGWSVLYYPGKTIDFSKLLQPYIIIGHCFDYTKVADQKNSKNFAEGLSMATQAGVGNHFNITQKLDCSLSGQYMFHLGKEITTNTTGGEVSFEKKPFSQLHGHLLFTISFNYKFVDLF